MHTLEPERALERQCAWCRTIVDRNGLYSLPSREILTGATYGICSICKAALLSAADEVLGPESDHQGA